MCECVSVCVCGVCVWCVCVVFVVCVCVCLSCFCLKQPHVTAFALQCSHTSWTCLFGNLVVFETLFGPVPDTDCGTHKNPMAA